MRDSVLEARDDAVLHLVAVGVVVGNAQGEPDIGKTLRIGVRREEEFEARGKDADDLRAARRAGRQHLAEYVGLAAEAALPVVVGDQEHGGNGRRGAGSGTRSGRRLRYAIGIDETAAEHGGSAHHGEEVGADGGAADQFRRTVLAGYYVAEGLYGGDVLKDGGGTVAQIEEIAVGEREILDVALAHIGEREDQAVRILVRQAAQENGVSYAENRSAGADAERDGENGGGGKDRALAQSAERVGKVTKKHASLLEFV